MSEHPIDEVRRLMEGMGAHDQDLVAAVVRRIAASSTSGPGHLLADQDRIETGEVCPSCAGPHGEPGDGVVRVEMPDGQHQAVACSLCDGATWVTASVAAEWRARNGGR